MLFASDPHLGLSTDSPFSGIPLKVTETLERLKECVLVCRSNNWPMVLGGDIFDSERPRSYAYEAFGNFVSYANENKVHVYVIPGNHDWNGPFCALSVFASMPNKYVKIILKDPYVFYSGGMSICLVPHLTKGRIGAIKKAYGNIRKWVTYKTGLKCFDILCTHAQVDGIKSNSETQLLESGTALRFTQDDFPKFDIGVFGHIHNRQSIKLNTCEVVYPGSIIMCDFGERKDIKGYVVVDVDGWRFEDFKTPSSLYKQINIDVTGKPFKVSDEQLKTFAGCLLKVCVISDDPVKIDEVAIRKSLNKYSKVVRFERKYLKPENSEDRPKGYKPILDIIEVGKLTKEWLERNTKDKHVIDRSITFVDGIISD